MASCVPAMVEYYRNYIGLDADDRSEEDDSLGFEDEIVIQEAQNLSSARDSLRKIIYNWPREAIDSKYQKFVTTLREVRDKQDGRCKVLVFAFFKDTLRYLGRRLKEDGFAAVIIDGDTPASERSEII